MPKQRGSPIIFFRYPAERHLAVRRAANALRTTNSDVLRRAVDIGLPLVVQQGRQRKTA
jgi:hypothetical protein